MKNLITYKLFEFAFNGKDNSFKSSLAHKIIRYLRDDNNFPELDTIKNIFQEVCDYCFVNGLLKPIFNKNICRIIDNNGDGNILISLLLNDIKIGNDFIKSKVYYKIYDIRLVELWASSIEINDKEKVELNNKIDTSIKRLKNCGFSIRLQDPKRHLFVDIIDTSDPVALEEIMDKQ